VTRRDLRLLAVLIVAASAALLGPLLIGRTHYAGDVLRSFQPWLAYAAQEIQAGKLPLWNPYSACGEPLLANPQVMTFFPPAQCFWLFPFADGWRLFFLLGMALWTVSLYLLYRRSGRAGAAFGALVVGWGGFTLIHWEFPSALATMPFAAFFILFSARGAARFLPLGTALLLLAGYTQFACYAFLGGAALALALAFRRRNLSLLAGMGAAVGLGAVLAAPQLAASWQAASESIRTGISAADARAHLLTPVFLLKFLVPDIYDKTVSAYAPMVFDAKLWPLSWNWLTTFYLGVAAPALAAAGIAAGRKRRDLRSWGLLGLAALAVAMGVEPFFSLARFAIPGMRYMTHFSNAMLIVLLALGALSAEGVRAGEKARPAALSLLAVGAILAALLALSSGARAWTAARLPGVEALTPDQDRWILHAALASLVTVAAAAPLLFLKRGRSLALIAFALLDVGRFGRDLQPTARGDFYRRPVALAAALQDRPDRFAIDPLVVRDNVKPLDGATPEEGYQSLRQVLFVNVQVPFRIHETWAYEVFPNRAFAEARRILSVDNPFGPLLDFLGARTILTTRPLPPPAVYRGQRPNALLYENPGALPRVTTVSSAKLLPDRNERLRFLAGDWDPRREVVLEEGETGPAGAPDGTRGLSRIRFRSEILDVESMSKPNFSRRAWKARGKNSAKTGTDSQNCSRNPYAGQTPWWDDGRPGRLRAEGTGGGWLVWSETFLPGWEAYLNGVRAPLRRANHAFQALRLPGGNWRAVVLYRPRLVFNALGAAALAATLLSAAGLVFFRKF
jgi:hypothetical protein